MTPCACCTMPTSSTSVSRWSVRRLDRCRSATPEGRRRGASADASRSTEAVAFATDGQASEEPIIELDVAAEIELDHAPLEHEPVPLSLPAGDVGMRAPCDHVADLRVTLEHRRERFDHRLEALARRDQPERRDQEPAACATI